MSAENVSKKENKIANPWLRSEVELSEEKINWLESYWRCANYLSIGQIYLRSNPLMRSDFEGRGFTRDDVKHRLVGHWGTTPGLNFLFAHLNRLIADHEQNAIFLMGPGHGGPAGTAQSLIDGSYTETYPNITDDEAGLQRFFRQFSYPGGIPSHFAPETPGSIHEGGELGYTLSHAYGAVMDNPSLLAVAVVGDGESETGPLATSWQSNKLVNPATDGIVLPILHLNGYKIANPTILARVSDDELKNFFKGMGYEPHFFVAGFDDETHESIHARFAELFEQIYARICEIKENAKIHPEKRPVYPMIVFRTPKGWTCPKEIDGKKTEDSWRAHQVPLASARDTQEHFEVLREWLKSYKPEELFDESGAISESVRKFMPVGDLRIGANPNANGGLIRKDLILPDPAAREIPVDKKGHGWGSTEAAHTFGEYTSDVLKNNLDNFRIFGPDETASNRLQETLKVSSKQWMANYYEDEANDALLAPEGKVIEQLSEHQCEGFLEGYVLTGRHGIWSSYESFGHVVDSMVNQHCKWLESCVREVPWRAPIAALNILLTSHVWRQDHNGFSHQDPGFIDLLLNKNFNNDHVVNAYYPADANMALAVAERAYSSVNCVNAIFCGKQPSPTFQTLKEAQAELKEGVAEWSWASTVKTGENPDLIIATCGDVPTLEALAATDLLKELGVSVRFINVVDLLKIQNAQENNQALSDERFVEFFGSGELPVLFCFHAYAGTIRRLIWNRPGHDNFHVHGYEEQGSTTTPYDMLRQNNMDRWALAIHALELLNKSAFANQIAEWKKFREEAFQFAVDRGYDHPAFTDWVWPDAKRDADTKGDGLSATQITAGDNVEE